MDLWTKIITLLIGSICFGEMCLGISETIYFKKYYDSNFDKDDCTIGGVVLGGVIFDTLCGSICFFSLITRLCNRETYQNINEFILRLHVCKLPYLISVIALYHANVPYYQYIMQNVPEFWTFLAIHFISGCVVIGTIIIWLLAMWFSTVYKKCPKKSQIVFDDSDDPNNNYEAIFWA